MNKTIFPILIIAAMLIPTSATAQQAPLRAKSSKPGVYHFEFEGGDAEAFADHLGDVFRSDDLSSRISIIVDTTTFTLPPLRVRARNAEEILKLYNRLSERMPGWGEWIWDGEFAETAGIALAPRTNSAASSFQQRVRGLETELAKPGRIPDAKAAASRSSFLQRITPPASARKRTVGEDLVSRSLATIPTTTALTSTPARPAKQHVRAFALRRHSEDEIEVAKELIEITIAMLSETMNRQGLPGLKAPRLSYHRNSKMLIVLGTDETVEVVNEILTAFDKNRAAEEGLQAPPKPVGPAPGSTQTRLLQTVPKTQRATPGSRVKTQKTQSQPLRPLPRSNN
jgi:hypothetical protein